MTAALVRLWLRTIWTTGLVIAAVAIATTARAAEPTKTFSSEGGRTTIFGVEGQGSKIVYVFDRSGSMGVPENKPLKAAKTELLASIDGLTDLQQFYVITYNHEPKLLDVVGVRGRATYANETNKRTCKQLIDAISAGGGTNHAAALSLALKLRPDTIFMLTDGDENDDMTTEEVARVARLNTGSTTIDVIQFGDPPTGGKANNLIQLAKESGGKHVYVDLLHFSRDRAAR